VILAVLMLCFVTVFGLDGGVQSKNRTEVSNVCGKSKADMVQHLNWSVHWHSLYVNACG
jgi:hypothetical protein